MDKNKYKVEIIETRKYIIDVLAKDEQEASDLASEAWIDISAGGLEHYYEDSEAETQVGTIYDVTGTDDPFSPLNSEPIQEKDVIRDENGDEVEQ